MKNHQGKIMVKMIRKKIITVIVKILNILKNLFHILFDQVDNDSENNIGNGSIIINEIKKNSLNLGEPNDSMIIIDNKDIINNKNNNNEDNTIVLIQSL